MVSWMVDTIAEMNVLRRVTGATRAHIQFLSALAAILVISMIAAAGWWVFRPPVDPKVDSFWKVFSSDRATMGFVRVAIIALCIYVLVSVAALVVGRRWLKTFNTDGLEVDPATADRNHEELVARLAAARAAIREGSGIVGEGA